jgi:hypothetical protein
MPIKHLAEIAGVQDFQFLQFSQGKKVVNNLKLNCMYVNFTPQRKTVCNFKTLASADSVGSTEGFTEKKQQQ